MVITCVVALVLLWTLQQVVSNWSSFDFMMEWGVDLVSWVLVSITFLVVESQSWHFVCV